MGFLGGLEKMKIFAYENDKFSGVGEEFSVYINPEKYSHRYKICYTDPQAQGSNGSSPNFNRMAAETVTFELVFDGTGVVPSVLPGVVPFTGDGVSEQIVEFKDLVFNYCGNIHEPKYLKLVWGTLLFKSRLRSLDISYTMFKPDGTPLRARAKMTCVGFTDEKELAKQAQKCSPDVTHLVTVKTGDTLPLLCFQIYGSSLLYREVARVNDLTDFRKLRTGAQLVFPPLVESEEAAS